MKRKRFLIIRAYPAGMCSCLMHIVNGLLYAELTERIPIVFWGERSLYYENTDEIENNRLNNSFEYYFKPLSNYNIEDVIGKGYSYFPSHWRDSNLFDDTVSSSSIPLPCALSFPGNKADVLVSTSLQRIEDLMKIISLDNCLRALSKEQLWYHFYTKYIYLKENIRQIIDEFYWDNMEGMNVLGLHIRKTDKKSEQAIPYDSKFIKAVDSYLSSFNDAKIFIATDCAKTLEKFKKIYTEKIIYTNSIRSNNSSPVHSTIGNNRLKGKQILTDVYLLTKCDHFIGSLSSNIAYVVLFMLIDPMRSKKKSTLVSHGFSESLVRTIMIELHSQTKFLRRSMKRVLSILRGKHCAIK